MTIIEERLDTPIILHEGAHDESSGQMCLLEAVAWVVGEPWSDHPDCVCPVLAAFGRSWNDGLPDDETRTRLLAPLIPRLVGTRSTPEVQDARAFMAADWSVRTFTPIWLRLAGLDDHAVALESLPPLDSVEACENSRAARDAAWDAAWAAAGVAAWDAAGDAARAAAGAAARDAAWAAAGAAAGAAAWAAARAAAWAAAWAAAGAALAPAVEACQVSALELLNRMIDLTEVPS